MAGADYEIKHSGSKSNEFYPLNKDIVNDESTGVPQDAPKTFRNKFTRFTKNILKSSKNLAVDVVGQYLPNTKEFGSSLNETRAALAASAKDKMSKARELQKKYSDGGNAEAKKDPIGYATRTAGETFKDMKSRLKSGDFYHTAEENMSVDDGFGDIGGGFDTDFGTTDSYELGSPETTLSEEPFGDTSTTTKRRVIKGTSNTRARNGNRSKKAIKGVASDASQLRLGDEYVAQTTSTVGTAVIAQSEKVWAKQMAVDELRHSVHMQFQKDILKGVNAISAHLERVEGTSAAASMEFQGKTLAMQQDMIGLMRELKQAIIVTSPEYTEYVKSRTGKILNNGGILNGAEYAKNIKGNVSDIVNSSPLGMLLGMAPMLGMAKDMGGSSKFDPLSMIVKSGFNSMLSKKTRGQLGKFDDMMGSAGGALVGKMNDLAKYGNSMPAQVIGKIFGVKDSYARQANLGLSSSQLTAQVSWNGKSDRTLNEVIPDRLSKIVAALTGKEEESYDYSTGGYRTQSAINKEYERVKQEADYNPILDRYKEQMTARASKSSLATNSSLSEEDIKADFAKIMENASKSNRGINASRFNNPKYMADLTKGTKHEESAVLFTQMYESMSPEEQTVFGGQLVKQNGVRSDMILKHEQDLIKNGGAASLSRIKNDDQVAMLENYLENSVDTDTNIDPNSPLYLSKLKKRRDTEKEIERLKSGTAGSSVSAVSVGMDGMTISDGSDGGSSSTTMIGSINNIFSLLSKGIIVFPRTLGEGETPDHLLKIDKANKARAAKAAADKELADKEAAERSDRIQGYNKTMANREREQKVLGRAGLGDLIGATNDEFKTKNAVNQGVARFANGAMKWVAGILGNPNGKSGNGLLETSEFDEAVMAQRKNAAQYLDPAMAKLKSMSGGKGILAKGANALYGNLAKRQASLNNETYIEGYDPKTGIIHKPGEGKGKLSQLNNKIHGKFLKAYGKYVSSTGQTVDTSTPEGEAAYLEWLKKNKEGGGGTFSDPSGMPREQAASENQPGSGPENKPGGVNAGALFANAASGAYTAAGGFGNAAGSAIKGAANSKQAGFIKNALFTHKEQQFDPETGEALLDKKGRVIMKKKKGLIRKAILPAAAFAIGGVPAAAAVLGVRALRSKFGKKAVKTGKDTLEKNTLFQKISDKVLGIKEGDKKTSREKKEEHQLALNTYQALLSIYSQLEETNPAVDMSTIKEILAQNVKRGIIDKDIVDAIVKEMAKSELSADTPLVTFKLIIDMLRKKYDASYKKGRIKNSLPMKMIKGVLAGGLKAGLGIGALMTGNPLIAGLLIAREVRRAHKLGKIKKAGRARDKQHKIDKKNGIFGNTEYKDPTLDTTDVAPDAQPQAQAQPKAEAALAAAPVAEAIKPTARREGGLMDSVLDKKSAVDERQENEAIDIQKQILETLKNTQSGLGINSKGQIDEDNKESIAGMVSATSEATTYTAENGGGGGSGGGDSIGGTVAEMVGDKVAGKVGGKIMGKFGGKLLTKVGGKVGGKLGGKLIGMGAGALAKGAGGAVTKGAGGLLSKGLGGSLAKGGGSAAAKLAGGVAAKGALGTLAKFAGPAGIALTLAQAGYGGFKGWKNAANIAGLAEGEKATTGQKVGAAASGALSSLTMGLIKPEQMYGAGKAIGKFGSKVGKGIGKFGSKVGKTLFGPDVDENGEYKKPSFGKKALRAASMLVPGVAPAMLISKMINNKKNKAAKDKAGVKSSPFDDAMGAAGKVGKGIGGIGKSLFGPDVDEKGEYKKAGFGKKAFRAASMLIPGVAPAMLAAKMFNSKKNKAAKDKAGVKTSALDDPMGTAKSAAGKLSKGIGGIGKSLFGPDVDENGEYKKAGFGKKAFRAASMLVPGVAPAMLAAKLLNSKKNKAAKEAAKAKAEAEAAKAAKSDKTSKIIDNVTDAGAVAVAAGKSAADTAAKKAGEVAVQLKSKTSKAKVIAIDAAEEAKRKADAIVGKTIVDKTITAEKEKPKKDNAPIPGSTAANPVKVKENPYTTNDKEFTKTINETLQTQKQIKDEMVRHNGLAEEFFTDLKAILESMVGRDLKRDEKQDKKDKQAKQGGFFSGISDWLGGDKGADGANAGASLDSSREVMTQALNESTNAMAAGS